MANPHCRQAALRADAVAGDDGGELAFILRQRQAIKLGMPEMDDAGGAGAVLAPHPGMQQPHDDVGILLAPAAEVGVETIDAIEIGPPDGEIARARAAPGTLAQPTQRPERQPQQRRQAIDPAARTLGDPAGYAPAFRRQVLAQNFGGQLARQQDAIAGDETARLRQPAVDRNKVPAHDAVAVEEDAVAAARGQDRAVANFGGAKSAVFVPDILEPVADLGLAGFD